MSDAGGLVVTPAEGRDDLGSVRALFIEYGQSLGFSRCFQGFDQEVAGLPGAYAPPGGRLLLARVGGRVAGCVGLRPLAADGADGVAEMKRLYVRPEHRGAGVGRCLAEAAVAAARASGYRTLRLDTLSAMGAARRLYEKLGFVEIAADCHNPLPEVRYYTLVIG